MTGRIADICRSQSTKLIIVGYGQLNSTTVLDFFAPGMYDTSYLNMQHLGPGHIFLIQQSYTLEASLKTFWNSIRSLRQKLY